MGGLKKYMPITFATMLTGWLAISGIPIFAGFFSKDEILWKTWSAGTFSLPSPVWSKALWFIGAVTALLTAVYMTRMMVMTFWGTERFREVNAGGEADEAHAHAYDIGAESHDAVTTSAGDRPRHEPGEKVHEPRESPWLMTAPLIVLAILSTVGGLIGVPYAISSLLGGHPENYIERILEPAIASGPEGSRTTEPAAEPNWLSPPPQRIDGAPAFAPLGEPGESEVSHSPEEIRAERLLALLSTLIAALGIGIGWLLFQKRPLLQMPRLLENKYYVDEVYDAAIIKPILVGSREILWKLFDVGVIDGFLHALGDAVKETARLVRHLQAGFVRAYAAIILLGALVVIGFFAYYGVMH